MTGNLITKLCITDSTNVTLQYLSGCGTDIDQPMTDQKENEQYCESEIGMEVIDGNDDPGQPRTILELLEVKIK